MKVVLDYITVPKFSHGTMCLVDEQRIKQVISTELMRGLCRLGDSPDADDDESPTKTSISQVNPRKKMRGDVWVAGGAAVYILNAHVSRESVGDIDIFVCNGNTAAFLKGIELVNRTIKVKTKFYVKMIRRKNTGVVTICAKSQDEPCSDVGIPIQFILSSKSIEDTIMAFDIDAAQCAVRWDSDLERYITLRTAAACTAHLTRTMRIFRDVVYDVYHFKRRLDKYIRKGFRLPQGVTSISNMQIAYAGDESMWRPTSKRPFNDRQFRYPGAGEVWKDLRIEINEDVKYDRLFKSIEVNRLNFEVFEPMPQADNRKEPEKGFRPLYIYIADRLQVASRIHLMNAFMVVTHPLV
jgi:hypothetical protein